MSTFCVLGSVFELIHTASYEVGPISIYKVALIKAYCQLSKENVDW